MFRAGSNRVHFIFRARFGGFSGPQPPPDALKHVPLGPREIMKELWPLIWPKGDWKSRAKVGAALSLLLGGKVSISNQSIEHLYVN